MLKPILITIGAVVGGLALMVGIFFATGWWTIGTADFRGEVAKSNLIEANAEFRVQAYDHFFDLCTAVQADEGRIESLLLELKTEPSEAREEQIYASMTAIRNNRIENIRQYNNDANKDYTEGQFLANNLPTELDPDVKDTQCSVPNE